MLLEKLILQGFKSFAPKTILEFPQESSQKKGITAIVGPNGCGKSNLCEAIRWALGEQSLKILRGKKSEDVIFSGSDKKARLGMAEVTLLFNNETGTAPIDYTELAITRRLYRSGESEYLINKKKVRLQDILVLLAKTNFGQKSYSIIGQGMIDSVLLASARIRKDFFDEATGIKQYQLKREEALRKIARTKTNLEQAEITLRELSPRVRSLTRQVNKLERREQIEKKLRELQKQYYGHFWHKLDKQWKQETKRWEKIEEEHQPLEKEVQEIQKKMKSLVGEDTESEILEKLETQREEIIQTKNKLLQKQAILQGQIELAKEKIAQAKETGLVSPLAAEKLLEGIRKIDNLQKNLISQLTKTTKLTELEEVKTLAEKIGKIVSDLLGKPGASPAPDKAILIHLTELKKKNEELQQELKELDEKISGLDQEIQNSRQTERDQRKGFFAYQLKFQKKQGQLNQLAQIVNEIKVELARLETRREALEEEINQELGKDGIKIIEQYTKQARPNFEESWLDEIEKLKRDIDFIGGIDPEVTKEYKECRERFDFLNEQAKDLTKAASRLKKIIRELDSQIDNQFKKTFGKIGQEFEKYFKILFGGGKAKLVLQKQEIVPRETPNEDSEIPDTKYQIQDTIQGIDILATPPGKKLKNIEMLSGGEKALTALALICAIISCNAPPFVVLDEVDAALDEANSVKFANIIERLSHKTQFIVVTHNRATMQKAGILYGVTMGKDGVSRLLSLKLEEAVK